MEDIFEFLAELVWTLIDHHKFRRQSTRTWVITSFWLIVGGILVGMLAWGIWQRRGNFIPGGAYVCWGLVAAAAAAWLFYVIRGHLRNWPRA